MWQPIVYPRIRSNRRTGFFLALTILVFLSFSISPAGAAETARLELTFGSTVLDNAITHPYLSDQLFRDDSGKLHAGLSHYAPHDGYYLRSTDNGATWPVNLNITREVTASKGGTVYINQDTGKGLYLGFFNVSGFNLNYTTDYGSTWTTGAYRFIPGASGGLTSYIYPLGSVYDGRDTVYALTWSSVYHSGNGKMTLSKTADLGATWTSLSGVANSNTKVLDSNETISIDAVDLLLDRDGNLFVLYMAKDTTGQWNLKAFNGATGARELVHANTGYTRFGTTAVTAWLDNTGGIHVAYVVETGPNEQSSIYHAVRDNAGGWTVQERVGSDGVNRRPSVASSTIDAAGNVYLVWCTYDGTMTQLFYSVCPAATQEWSPAARLLDSSAYSTSNPYLKALDAGKVEMLWTKANANSRSVQYGQFELVGATPVDTTPPEITPVINGVLGDNGWYVSDVSVAWLVTDPESEVTGIIGGETTVITEDTAGTNLTCQAESAGGVNSQTVAIRIDKTKPVLTITAPVDSPYLASGSLVLDFDAADCLSGIDTSTAYLDNVTVHSGQTLDLATMAGSHTLTVEARDQAGNQNYASVCFEVLIPANVEIMPKTLNLKSNGGENSVTAKIALPEGYLLHSIDPATIILTVNGVSLTTVERPNKVGRGEGPSELIVKFDRQELAAAIGTLTGNITLQVSGKLDDGIRFTGSDTILVIAPENSVKRK